MVISWIWLLPAFAVGAVCGAFIMAALLSALVAGARVDRDAENDVVRYGDWE